MPPLSFLLPCLLFLLPAEYNKPITPWLNKAAANQIEGEVTNDGKTIQLPLNLTHPFSGEVVLLDQATTHVYQAHHELPTGTTTLQLATNNIPPGTYLLLLHDFSQRNLKTSMVHIR